MSLFASAASYPSDADIDLAVTDDRRAFTLGFRKGFEVVADSGRPPIATRTVTLVLPLQADAAGGTIDFRLTALPATRPASAGTLLLSVNGRTAVADASGGGDAEVIVSLAVDVAGAADCRIVIAAIASRSPANPESAAFVNVSSLDAEFRPHR